MKTKGHPCPLCRDSRPWSSKKDPTRCVKLKGADIHTAISAGLVPKGCPRRVTCPFCVGRFHENKDLSRHLRKCPERAERARQLGILILEDRRRKEQSK